MYLIFKQLRFISLIQIILAFSFYSQCALESSSLGGDLLLRSAGLWYQTQIRRLAKYLGTSFLYSDVAIVQYIHCKSSFVNILKVHKALYNMYLMQASLHLEEF